VRVQVANRRRSGPTSPSGTQPLKPNSAPTAVAEPVDSPTSLADWLANWFVTIAVTIAIVAVTTWLVLGGCATAKRKHESHVTHGLSAANAETLQQEIERVYRADGSGRVGGLDEGPKVSFSAYRLVIDQWRQHLGPYLPNVDFSEVKLPTQSMQNGTVYKNKPDAKEFLKNTTEISSGIPRRQGCTLENLCEAAVAKAAEAAPTGSLGLVRMECDLLRQAITQVVELAAEVGVRRSYLEGAGSSINALLAKHMRRHREAAQTGASSSRFSLALIAGPTADVSARVREAAAFAQAGKSLTMPSPRMRDTLGVQGKGASWGRMLRPQRWRRGKAGF
jgi:hypothetical protein